MVLSLLLGCAISTQGVVRNEDARTRLLTAEGRDHRLTLGVESEPVRYLEDCTVQIDGRRALGGVIVTDWSVITAADGSAPYVGVLR
ncbi:MAG: hypothetical protein AAFU55_03540, partial [Pseudomonadota bacterium]